jgi:hypothetical protein
MINAFLDEAGTHDGCPVVTVAGFYGNQNQWTIFRRKWRPHSVGFHALACDERFPDLCAAIEASQINGLFVGESCMAAVDSAKKSDSIELHTADFVSHCASSHDKPWLQRLFDANRLKHGHIGERQLQAVAPELTSLVKKAKHQRLKAKRAR